MEEYLSRPRRKSSRIDIHYYIGSQKIDPNRIYELIEMKQERAMIHHHIRGENCNDYCEEVDYSGGY